MASTALKKAQASLLTTRRTLARRSQDLRSAPMKAAYRGGAATLAGAAACGLLKGTVGDDVMGAPIEPVAAAVAAAAGFASGNADLVNFAVGLLAPYIAQTTEELIS